MKKMENEDNFCNGCCYKYACDHNLKKCCYLVKK